MPVPRRPSSTAMPAQLAIGRRRIDGTGPRHPRGDGEQPPVVAACAEVHGGRIVVAVEHDVGMRVAGAQHPAAQLVGVVGRQVDDVDPGPDRRQLVEAHDAVGDGVGLGTIVGDEERGRGGRPAGSGPARR